MIQLFSLFACKDASYNASLRALMNDYTREGTIGIVRNCSTIDYFPLKAENVDRLLCYV